MLSSPGWFYKKGFCPRLTTSAYNIEKATPWVVWFEFSVILHAPHIQKRQRFNKKCYPQNMTLYKRWIFTRTKNDFDILHTSNKEIRCSAQWVCTLYDNSLHGCTCYGLKRQSIQHLFLTLTFLRARKHCDNTCWQWSENCRSHTLNAFFVCHTTMQQHFIDNITELESTKKAKKTIRKTLRGGRVGKTVALSGKKRKLTHVTERETNILARTQVPHSVWENFVSCLLRKLSRQKKHVTGQKGNPGYYLTYQYSAYSLPQTHWSFQECQCLLILFLLKWKVTCKIK